MMGTWALGLNSAQLGMGQSGKQRQSQKGGGYEPGWRRFPQLHPGPWVGHLALHMRMPALLVVRQLRNVPPSHHNDGATKDTQYRYSILYSILRSGV